MHASDFGDGFHDIDPKLFFNQSVRTHVSLTPTVVYRRAIAPDLMFDAALRVAGEDCLFSFSWSVRPNEFVAQPGALLCVPMASTFTPENTVGTIPATSFAAWTSFLRTISSGKLSISHPTLTVSFCRE